MKTNKNRSYIYEFEHLTFIYFRINTNSSFRTTFEEQNQNL